MTKKRKSVKNDGIAPAGGLGDFGGAITQICEEKGISRDKVLETVEAALAAAYKKDYGKKGQNVRAKFDAVSGDTKFWLVKEVVDETVREFPVFEEETEGEPAQSSTSIEASRPARHASDDATNKESADAGADEEKLPRYNSERDLTLEEAKKIKKDAKVGDIIEIELETQSNYGRVAAQTAKQVIIQKIREAERDAMFSEYKNREGEVLNGTVQRVEGRNVYIDIGKSVGVLFPSEQIERENYRIGQRIKVFLTKVDSSSKGPGITLSRVHPDLVKKLFELEVPEIFAGTVEIKAVAREAGERTKIAVSSNEEGVDPIGSCVGQKGTRVQTIIDELGGEKIDIVLWNDDIKKFIPAAISPAKVLSVETNEETKEAILKVAEDQLSLAIGKRGQNVRLAAKLTGWKIDIVGVNKEGEELEKDGNSKPAEPAQSPADIKADKKKEEIKEEEKAEEKTEEIVEEKAEETKEVKKEVPAEE